MIIIRIRIIIRINSNNGVTNKKAVALLRDSTFFSFTDKSSPSDVLIGADTRID